MGREIKRVPLNFDWRLKRIWWGYINPWYKFQTKCEACDGSGYNPETKQIKDDWYDFAGTGRRWVNAITQDETNALVAAGRLWDLTRDFVPGKGWQDADPPRIVTAAQVNAWSRASFGHDAINSWICIETRAKRLGAWGHCETCQGEGEIWDSALMKVKAKHWRQTQPPKGDGWQIWETVSEGSPISSVFETADACIAWLVSEGYSQGAASEFVLNDAWAPSMVMVTGGAEHGVYNDIESAALSRA